MVPIRVSGGASEIIVRRPVGVAVRAHLKGWVSAFIFDDQTHSDMDNNVWLQSSGFEPTAPYYDIEVSSSPSMVTITLRGARRRKNPFLKGAQDMRKNHLE